VEEKILKQIYESLNEGIPVAMATLTHIIGSTPRKKGSVMAVWPNGKILGSIGGGRIEHEVILKAKECIEKNEDSDFEYKLNDSGDIGMQCGGEAKGFIKVFTPRKKLVIVGGGHIGEQLYKFAKLLNFYTVIFDNREEFANRDKFSQADEVIAGDIEYNLSNYDINENTYVVITTGGHAPDSVALKAVISRGAAYVGMIGSTRKTITIMKNLMEEGVSKEDLEKVHAPIGLDISSQLPEEIALGIISEVLLIKNKGSLRHKKDIHKIIQNLF
jgi:xanthine dehydrogenase accessory factor